MISPNTDKPKVAKLISQILAETMRRERARGDRRAGEAVYHLKTHGFVRYDLEVDTTCPLAEIVEKVVERWRARLQRPG